MFFRVGEPLEVRAIAVRCPDLHLVIVVPGVAAMLARGAKLEFGLHFCARFGIMVRRGKRHLVCAGAKKGTGGLADAGRNAVRLAGFEVEQVNLVKRIVRLAFALED